MGPGSAPLRLALAVAPVRFKFKLEGAVSTIRTRTRTWTRRGGTVEDGDLGLDVEEDGDEPWCGVAPSSKRLRGSGLGWE